MEVVPTGLVGGERLFNTVCNTSLPREGTRRQVCWSLLPSLCTTTTTRLQGVHSSTLASFHATCPTALFALPRKPAGK